MFKKLFLILFLVQTLASAAWGAVGAPVFTPSEQIEMKVMHHVMHLDSAVMNGFKVKAYQAGQCVSNPQMLSCDQCNTTSCHNLLCASIHAAPVFNLVDTFKVNLQPLQIDSNVIFVVPLTTTTVQPELPPPNTISI